MRGKDTNSIDTVQEITQVAKYNLMSANYQKVPFRMTFPGDKYGKKEGAQSAPSFFPPNILQVVILKGTF
jgi:hypothetical protein